MRNCIRDFRNWDAEILGKTFSVSHKPSLRFINSNIGDEILILLLIRQKAIFQHRRTLGDIQISEKDDWFRT